MEGFNKTPSFYDTNEKFKKYLGQTSFYIALQKCVCKLVKLAKPKEILELGFGTGETTVMLAKENLGSNITSVDIREEMKKIAEENAKNNELNNISFHVEDMVKYVEEASNLPEFIVFLYSFHHVEDPLSNKVDFLKECFERMPSNGRLCIAETFLPESTGKLHELSEIKSLWGKRIKESYTSTFWSSLSGLGKENIDEANLISKYSLDNEARAGELVWNRDNEYLVSMGWLVDTAKAIGFEVEISEYCNSVGDGVILLKKAK